MIGAFAAWVKPKKLLKSYSLGNTVYGLKNVETARKEDEQALLNIQNRFWPEQTNLPDKNGLSTIEEFKMVKGNSMQ